MALPQLIADAGPAAAERFLEFFAAQIAIYRTRNIATTQRYTHLRPLHEIPAHERLADAVPIADLVTLARRRAGGKPDGKSDGTHSGTGEETRSKDRDG
jgi:hypothetical protein